MFDAYKRFFRFAGEQKGTWYKGMAFELLRSIFEALQFAALLIVLRGPSGPSLQAGQREFSEVCFQSAWLFPRQYPFFTKERFIHWCKVYHPVTLL